MGTILDYIDWRGDLSFASSDFNEIDSLILCQLSYLNFEDIVPQEFNTHVTLNEASNKFFESNFFSKRSDIGPLINQNTFELLKKAGKSNRFGSIKMCGYAAHLDSVKEKQFSATTFLLGDKTFYIAYRGTDASLIGWKEDFNMAFMSPVPAQQEAIKYLEKAATRLHGKIRIGGHSKGGNLAIYSSAFCNNKFKKRIIQIYDNDGPGFDKQTMNDDRFKSVVPYFKSFIPQSSVVGMLFEHPDGYTIIESSETNGIMQHDPFSWHIKGIHFVTRPELTAESIFLDTTVKDWLAQMSREQRITFIDTLFKVLEATKAQNLSELSENWTKNTPAIIKALTEIDSETRYAVLSTIKMLFSSAKKNFPKILELLPLK